MLTAEEARHLKEQAKRERLRLQAQKEAEKKEKVNSFLLKEAEKFKERIDQAETEVHKAACKELDYALLEPYLKFDEHLQVIAGNKPSLVLAESPTPDNLIWPHKQLLQHFQKLGFTVDIYSKHDTSEEVYAFKLSW